MNNYILHINQTVIKCEGCNLETAITSSGFKVLTLEHETKRKPNGKYWVTAEKDGVKQEFFAYWIEKYGEPEFFTYEIFEDGKLKKTFENQLTDISVFKYLLKAQGQSISYALKYGWNVDVTNQKTGVKTKY